MATWKEDLVQINPYSRPGTKLDSVIAFIMHWTGNPGASDENHAAYFDGADGGGGRYASAHLFADRDSTTLIIPLNEMAYHANDVQRRNADGSPYRGVRGLGSNANTNTISYEMCVEKDGTIHPDTVNRAVKDLAELCRMFGKDPLTSIFRHFDVTAKNCPAPWVKDPSQFDSFKQRVKAELNGSSAPIPSTGKTYTVQPGDTLWGIGQKTGVSVANLKAYSNLTSDLIHPGQVLKLGPVSAPVSPQPAPSPTPSTPSYVGKRVEAKVDVRYYNRPSWADKDVVGVCKAGLGFTIVEQVLVNGSPQYKVKNSKGSIYYITASTKYVRVE